MQVHNHLVLVLHHSALKWVPEQCSPRTRANPSRQPLLGRCKKKKKKKKAPTQCSRRHTLQFALAGSLHAVCNLRLICEPSKH